jgi:pyruvate formate lyase activating enzyme
MNFNIGRIHSVETCGTVDGPGVRFVVFMQGCALKCLYCHNPDSRAYREGSEITAEDLFAKIWAYRSFFKASSGGVTFSGGEPLLQAGFVAEMLEALHSVGIHTALDTSGYPSLDLAPVKRAVDYASLVLLDIKHFSPEKYQRLTGVSLEPTLKMAQYLADKNHPTWIRYVLVPGFSDDLDDIKNLAQFLKPMTNIQKVQILPFHKMGEYKWKELGLNYELSATEPPTAELVQQVTEIFQEHNLKTE